MQVARSPSRNMRHLVSMLALLTAPAKSSMRADAAALPLAAALACAAAAAGACGTDSAPADASFDAVVQDVLVPRCTFSSCHAAPTVAAGLDLTAARACGMLLDQPSCLFPDRMRVVPGAPADSFLFHKVADEGLDQAPTGTCASTNLLMPFGGAQIPDAELALVRGWIAAGAECAASPDQPGDAAPGIATLTADRAAPVAGETVTITLTLDRAAPEGGQVVTLAMDTTAISAPVQVVVPAGATTAQLQAYALRPASRFALRATTGKSTKALALRVAGLDIVEVLTDPIGADDGRQWIKLRNRSPLPLELGGYTLKAGDRIYDTTTVHLAGPLPPGGCAVIGGPEPSSVNGAPVYTQAIDFQPDLPHPRTATAGFAVFDRDAAPVDGVTAPIDAMIIGANNSARLIGPDGEIPPPYCATPVPGASARRAGPTACVESALAPNECP